jgi:hypothetical protein
MKKRTHANSSHKLPGTSGAWVPECRCGWQGPLAQSRDATRLRWREHQQWAVRSLGLQLRKRREENERTRATS